jgi:subtilisin family serine protease
MKNFLRLMSLTTVVCLLIAGSIVDVWAQTTSAAVVSGKVRIKFSSGMEATLKTMKVARKSGYIQTGIAGFDVLAVKHKAMEMTRVFPYNPKKEAVHRKHGLHLWYELTVPLNTDVESAAREFKRLGNIAHAEPIRAKAAIQPGKATIVSDARISSVTEAVNDPLFYLQWHYENDGETNGGIPEADINLVEAWKVQTGDPNVIVAVHDLGIDVKHRDLAANVWVNLAEKNGRPGVDDDYNGYIDDINGYDFSGDSGTIPPGDHGTHVAGTIAAVTNNGIGVSGVAGGDGVNSGVKVMSAKILNGMYDNTAASYIYAADNGAVISQNSWTYTTPGAYDQAVLDAIDYFIEEAGNYPNSPMKGGIVIFAAGNSNNDLDYYPEAYDHVMAVASLGRTNQKAFYSNYGAKVELSAPGGDQYNASEDGILSTLPDNQYGFFQGTSMACPHVSGIAALVVSQHGGKNYTAQDLWTALITGTHDINQYNPDYIDQLGVGYIDAALALKTNEKVAPAIVTDLLAADTGQDYIGLTWSVSSDRDDGVAAKYEITYAQDSLDVARRKNIKTATVANLGDAGAKMQYSIGKLFAATKYYVAIYAIDRWGNKSAISAIIKVKTTEGPSVMIDRSSLEFSIDVTTAIQAQDAFIIQNNANGELRWKGEVRQRDYSLDWNHLKYPAAKVTAGSVRKPGVQPSRVNLKDRPKAVTTGYNDSYEPREIRHVLDEYYGGYMIGEEDTTISNSSATRFIVPYADGFNMTDLRLLVNNNIERNDPPFIVEIYRGETMDRQNLVYASEFSGNSNYDVVYSLQLGQQLYFASGSTFWVVVHMPAGHLYPLGMSEEAADSYSDNCFISFDVGKNWTPLADAIQNPYYAWVQTPVSNSPALDQYITLLPEEGAIAGKDITPVAVAVDGSHLINGEYRADVVVLNNDYSNSLTAIPVTVQVKGQKPVLSSASVADFGGIFIGRSKELELTINNTGYGNFIVDNATVSNDDFVITNTPYKINALGNGKVSVKYTAKQTGTSNGVLTLSDASGNKYSISLVGVGISPSKISLTPAAATYNLALGATATGKFTIKNTGNYPLQYFMPKYASGEGIDYVSEGYNAYGYSYRTSTDGSGLAYTWEDIAATGKDITTFFKDVVNNDFYPVKLGFDFPIFNQTTDQLMITRYGMLTIDDKVNVVGNMIDIGSEYMPFGFISAFNQGISAEGGKIYYQAKPGKLIVQYDNVPHEWDDTQHITFQIIVYDNGNVLINYKDISLDAFNTNYIEVAIEDPAKKFGYLISNYEKPLNAASGFSVEINSPGRDMMQEISSTTGTLAVGASTDVTYKVETSDLTEGSFWQNLVIVSNDPATPAQVFKAQVNITSGGTPNIALSTDALDLGDVFIGDEVNDIVQVQNTGTKAISIKSITSDHGYFTITHDALPYSLKARSSLYIGVAKKGVTAGEVNDNLHITFSDNSVKHVAVHAVVQTPPNIALAYDAIEDVLEAGTSADHTISITNNGASTLNVVPSGTSWVYPVDTETAAGAAGIQYPKNTYYWSTSKDGSVQYVWEEIMKKENRIDFVIDGYPEEKEMPLPFAFRFYGKEYNKVYVSTNGLVYFTPNQPVGIFTSGTIPDPEGPNNFIAPFWSNGAFYSLDNDVYGVYYHATEDVVTIEYVNQYNIFGMGDPWNMQVLLYKNGNIRYQYQIPGWTYTNGGVIGVENEDGTEGVRIAAYQNFIENGLAVVLTPANRVELAAGETKTVNVRVDATELMAGDYTSNLLLQTNVPGKTSLHIPVSLTVTGVPKLIAPDAVDFGDVVAKEADGIPATYSQEFTLSNTGAAMLNFTQLQMKSGSDMTLWMEMSGFFGNYWAQIPGEVAAGDIILSPKQTQKFRITVSPAMDNYTLTDALVIESNDPAGLIEIPVQANVVLPPAMRVSRKEIVFQANDNTYTGSESFVISNKKGLSPLKYSVSMQYQRIGTTLAPVAEKSVKSGAIPSIELASAGLQTGITAVEGYNRTLEYIAEDQADNMLGFGIGGAFVSGTKFTAPGDGFTLTHVQTYYASGDLESSLIKVSIYAGDDVETAALLASEEYELALGKNYKNTLMFDLKTPITFYPGETFFVVISYPLGTGHPQGTSNLTEAMPGKFLYYYSDAGVWSDINSIPDYRKAAWFVKALEKDFVNGSWLTLPAVAEGSVAAGDSLTVSVMANAANMGTSTDAYATIAIRSNDPAHATTSIKAQLHINQAPQFEEKVYEWYVTETETSVFEVPVTDLEGEAVTGTIPDAPTGMTWTTSATGITVTYTPDYISPRVINLTIQAKDAGNRNNTKPVTINVWNMNRAPVVVDHTDRHYDYAAPADDIAMSSIITDPDIDDVLNVSAISSDITVAEVMASSDKLRIKPKKAGESILTITATDNSGASVTTTLKVVVNLVTAIETTNFGSVKLYPNPTSGILNLSWEDAGVNVENAMILNVTGEVLQQPAVANRSLRADVSSLAPGFYLIKLQNKETSHVFKFIKQ